MPKGMTWIKLYTELLDDPKVGRLPDALKWRFTSLCLVAGECDAGGALSDGDAPLGLDDLAWRLRCNLDDLAEQVRELVAADLLHWDEAVLTIAGGAAAAFLPPTIELAEQKAARHAYRARKAGSVAPGFTGREWLTLCAKYGNRCLSCGRPRPLTPDHIVPLALGGSNSGNNIQPLCLKCNMAKGTAIIDYRPRGEESPCNGAACTPRL